MNWKTQNKNHHKTLIAVSNTMEQNQIQNREKHRNGFRK
jgi:hypothetical protein